MQRPMQAELLIAAREETTALVLKQPLLVAHSCWKAVALHVFIPRNFILHHVEVPRPNIITLVRIPRYEIWTKHYVSITFH